ncbi:cytochrome b [Fretibacter rubidus]|uniref:cytochrome b n=1 Tax=Fretibacter rubidus TaxID=570162 RepID=UPI00352AE51C
MGQTTSQSYTRTAVILHWLIAIMIIGQLMGGKIMMWIEPTPFKFELFQLHKSFGFIILGLSILRLIWRLMHEAPSLPEGMKPWEIKAAKATHVGFYALIIGIPLSGWIMVSVSTPKITTKIFKAVKVPDLPLPRTETLETITKTTHEILGALIAVLIIVHVGAALKHYFVNKDGVLARMIPHLKPKA